MGFVHDSYEGPRTGFKIGTQLTAGQFIPTFSGMTLPTLSKTQYGYRSGPLGPEEREALDRLGSKKLNRATMGEALGALEAIYRADSSSVDPWMVNYREYDELALAPTQITSMSAVQSSWIWYPIATAVGAMGIDGLDESVFPSAPTLNDQRNWAESKMRSMSPIRPDFRLARFLGELRDANKMFRANSYFLGADTRVRGLYLPKPSSLAAANLNYQFAVVPTISDIKKGAEAVLKSEKIMKQYIRDATRTIRRTSERQIDSKTFRENGVPIGPTLLGGTCAGMKYRCISGAIPGPYYQPQMIGYLNTRLTQRAFATYSYAIPDLDGIAGRYDQYVGEAQRILGIKFDAQTLYDLTPFSWMLDWFVDIGGVLGFQQQVADYQLVAKRAGFTLEWSVHGELGMSQSFPPDTSDMRGAYNGGQTATVVGKRQVRRSGNPFGMSPDWNFSDFQWQILGSLGLAWAPKIPVFRNG